VADEFAPPSKVILGPARASLGILAKEIPMESTSSEIQTPIVIEEFPEQRSGVMSCDAGDFRLRRWLVSFASGSGWYAVGEYVALDAQAAIDRAVEVFGKASDYRAEEIPWDADPLPRPIPGAKKYKPKMNADEHR
jgi:hypothetical protein